MRSENSMTILNPEIGRDEIIRVSLIDGVVQPVRKKHVLGICHSAVHPGGVTKSILEKHNCLGKACPKFEKIDDASYWRGLEDKKHRKEKQKSKQLAEKARQQELDDFLWDVKDICQAYIDDIGYEMDIIRVEKVSWNVFKLFYVSEYPFADGNRFPEFLAAMKRDYPSWRICLRHIKDVDGHFVTCDEFYAQRR